MCWRVHEAAIEGGVAGRHMCALCRERTLAHLHALSDLQVSAASWSSSCWRESRLAQLGTRSPNSSKSSCGSSCQERSKDGPGCCCWLPASSRSTARSLSSRGTCRPTASASCTPRIGRSPNLAWKRGLARGRTSSSLPLALRLGGHKNGRRTGGGSWRGSPKVGSGGPHASR